MMLEPSIDKLQEKINSKYTLVTLSARRARQMLDTDSNSLLIENPTSYKQVGIALEEVLADKLFVTKK
ncbi:DNA-directed RNA polymerase subunit omega [Virgibacillus necropolis]|uniref:DNA-directed RNA polymerase subunit omega n=1 Tax=Virgibacillus necropolis TaxID=163877 RepID=A0A221MDZ0_9BACI|nr:DNA-directed RNA polymerase subunit omega [Virgibacillus necropolis]ASN05820.1 DNA-directed RNA polymerase subunit omega [Virgibacillus necropolis]